MSKLPLPVRRYKPIEIKGNLDVVQSILSNTATGQDIRMAAEAFSEYHPYLKYINSVDFSDEELLERQTESISAIAATVSRIFGSISASVLKVAGSSKGLPAVVKWMGMGTTWGAFGAWVAFDWASGAGMEKLMAKFQLSTKGISDLDGLNKRRMAMPNNATFNLEKGAWTGKNPLTVTQVLDLFSTQIDTTNKIVGMANTVMTAGSSPKDLDSWLSTLHAIKGDKQSTGAVATPTLHGNLGMMVYKNGAKYFVEEVVAKKATVSTAIVPTTTELLSIQRSCKELIRSTNKLDSAIKQGLKQVSNNTDGESNAHLSFAGRTLREFGLTVVKSNKMMLHDSEHLVRQAIAAIITADVDESGDNPPEK